MSQKITDIQGSSSHLAVFGASRGVGRAVVEQALAKGHRVTAVARNGADLRRDFPTLEVVEGDVSDSRTVDRALEGVETVVCALGAKAFSNSRVRSEGTAAIARGMKRRGISRIVAVSLMGAGETRKHLPFFFRYVIFPLYLRKPVADHERQEELLRTSDLDWTIVRPPNLDDGPQTAEYVHGVGTDWSELSLVVSRKQLAHFILGQVGSKTYERQSVWVSRSKTPGGAKKAA